MRNPNATLHSNRQAPSSCHPFESRTAPGLKHAVYGSLLIGIALTSRVSAAQSLDPDAAPRPEAPGAASPGQSPAPSEPTPEPAAPPQPAASDEPSAPAPSQPTESPPGPTTAPAVQARTSTTPAPTRAPASERRAAQLGDDPDSDTDDDFGSESEGPEESDAEPKKKKKKGAKVYGRLMAGWNYLKQRPVGSQTGDERDRQELFLKQARVYFKAGGKKLRLNISAELADGLEPGYLDQFDSYEPEARKVDYIRNAYVNWRVRDEVQFRIGHFKRPFSRLELRSAGSLPFSDRGLVNAHVVEGGRRFGQRNLYWGDRGTGIMFWGRTDDKFLGWYASATNPGFDAEGIDAHLRGELRPADWFRVGAGGALKNTTDVTTVGTPDEERVTLYAGSVDFRFEHSELLLVVDFLAGQNVADLNSDKPFAGGLAGFVSYDLPLAKKLTLRPAVFGEYADRNFETTQSEAVRIALGLNLLIGKKLRLLSEVELRRPVGEKTDFNPVQSRDTYTLMAVAEF